jgi:hypothetical protein
LDGADTKALPCVDKNAVATFPIADDNAELVAPTAVITVPPLVTGVPVCAVVQFCAKAPDDAEQAIATVKPALAKILPP